VSRDLPLDQLNEWLRLELRSDQVAITRARLLSGGAIQQNWSIEVEGKGLESSLALVLRTDNPSSLGVSRSRADEFALLKAAHEAGVRVPEPMWFCGDEAVIGRPFFTMRRVQGMSLGAKLVKSEEFAGDHLATALGRELALIHTIKPPRPDLAFLGDADPARVDASAQVEALRVALDQYTDPHPVLEWGLRHLELNAPLMGDAVLCHNDFRTGNYMVDATGVTGILDWEFASWGDLHQDIGWFCAKCWRFGRNDREAGGIGSRAAFYGGYEDAGGQAVDSSVVGYWELMATARWAVIALAQAQRFTSGGERELELALTGHVVPTLEQDILEMVK
jgi:aminoglycoside phosphotransferase (APT) family kinase protein